MYIILWHSLCSFLGFLAVSVITGSRIFRPYLVVNCRDFLAVSAVSDSQIFRPYLVVTCRGFLAVSAATGSRIFRPYLWFLAVIFWPYLFRYGNVKSLPPDTRWPGFSGRICCFWPGFSCRSFSGEGNLKKLYGRQANCSGIDSGIFCP